MTGKGLGWSFAGHADDECVRVLGRPCPGLSVISSETRSSSFTFNPTCRPLPDSRGRTNLSVYPGLARSSEAEQRPH